MIIHDVIESDRFRSILTTTIESAQLWAKKIALLYIMHDEMNLETDRFKLIFTTSVVSAQIWAINMAVNGSKC